MAHRYYLFAMMASIVFVSYSAAPIPGKAAAPSIIDFSFVTSFTTTNRIERIDDVTFSWNLFTYPDGFELLGAESYNFYGEQDEYFEFDAPMFLKSMDLRDFGTASALTNPDPLYVELFDSGGGSLGVYNFDLTETYQTFVFGVSNVKKVVFRFDGGTDFYGEGRDHAWYSLDNISYDLGPPVAVEASSWGAVKYRYLPESR